MLDAINPDDVFPRRNLPADAEQWGRNVEDRIRDLEGAVVQLSQMVSGLSRDIKAVTGNITSGQQTPFSYTRFLSDQDLSSSDSTSSHLYTTTSVTVPTGAISATITVKGSVTATNDASVSPAQSLTLLTQGWYAHLASGTPWEPGLIDADNRFTWAEQVLPTGATATAVTTGSTTFSVTPGYKLVVGTVSRFGSTFIPQSVSNASTFVTGTIEFTYAT